MRFFALCLFLLVPSAAFAAEIRNDRYSLSADVNGSLTITNLAGGSAIFKGRFAIISTATNPKVAMRPMDSPAVRYHAPAWLTKNEPSSFRPGNPAVEQGDGMVGAAKPEEAEKRTYNIFNVERTVFVDADGATQSGRRIEWKFPAREDYTFTASVELPAGTGEPILDFSLTPNKAAWYSIAYAGAPSAELSALDAIWQPLIWQEKRFPPEPMLTPAGYCTLPAALINKAKVNIGVVVDPSQMPFMPLPSWSNSRFAVGIRNETGLAQPMVFAPMLGGPGSNMPAGKPFTFQLRLYVQPGDILTAYEDIARSLYGFHDYRENVVTLNQTIENVIDYGMSKFSRFDDDLKGCMYETDVPGAVKNVSSLHPMEMAVITDNAAIFDQRARPILEYLLSRERFLFVLDKKVKTQNPSRLMNGPAAEGSEFAAAYSYGGGLSPVLLGYAETHTAKKANSSSGDSWIQQMELYRTTGDKSLLEKARAGADAYIADRITRTQTSFDDTQATGFFFWTSYSPLWINLLDLYEETREPRYLQAAHMGAREFTQYVMMSPRIPEGDVTVNPGGVAPLYSYLKKKTIGPMKAPQESVPAWRLSEIGLTAESSSTIQSHRAIFMATYAAWMMRIAALTGDKFLHDVSRSALVGRSANFPGYHINTERSTVYEKPDYPYHPHNELSYNSFHYNHVWPYASLLFDFLVNDVFAKSQQKIDFPGRYSQGYGYLQTRIYGDRPGIFYDEKDVRLWMPKGLLKMGNPQINYLAGRRGDTLFLALANQSQKNQVATLSLNPTLVGWPKGKTLKAKVWQNNQPARAIDIVNGNITIPVPASGLAAVAIKGLAPRVGFQQMFGIGLAVSEETKPEIVAVGDARATVLSFGDGLTNAYIYLRKTDDDLDKATLHYRDGAVWKTLADAKYPFEFSVPIPKGAENFEFMLETTDRTGKLEKSPNIILLTAPNHG